SGFMTTDRLPKFAVLILVLCLQACSSALTEIPTVADEKLEHYVTAMGLQIVAVSEHRDRSARYRFKLVDFARRDILGLSTGHEKIFVSYELSRLAYKNRYYRWLLRQTLAHEIGHDVLGGDRGVADEEGTKTVGLANRITSRDLGLSDRVKFFPYSRSAELAADRKGMEYWRKLGWNCSHWVRLFLDFTAQGYRGDVDHPTEQRLAQAIQFCSEQSMEDNH
ncbi:MAG TPA: hypothetical protein VE131_08505, partial [Terriglobales bacterium]|nr:hypothetical protein [Terriglobales bacterium]